MSDLSDFELRQTPGESEVVPPPAGPEPEGPRYALWIAGALAALAIAAGAGYRLLRKAEPAATPAPTTAAELPEPSPSPIDVGPLDGSDPLVAGLARALSSDARWLEWWKAKDLVRRFVAAVAQTAAGESPRKPLDFLSPKQGFTVVQTPVRIVIDRASYARYDPFVAVVSTLDAAACARALRKIQPLLDTAYAEAGAPDRQFSLALEKALRLLLETPLPEGDVVVKRAAKSVVYEYADPKLEGLTSAQKHLLRAGPVNASKLKAKLREFGLALDLELP